MSDVEAHDAHCQVANILLVRVPGIYVPMASSAKNIMLLSSKTEQSVRSTKKADSY